MLEKVLCLKKMTSLWELWKMVRLLGAVLIEKSKRCCLLTAIYLMLPIVAEAINMKKNKYLKFFFLPPEPESSPQDVEVTDVTAHEISLKWLPPEKPNGIIVAYEVLYKNTDSLFMKNTSTTHIILRDLKPYSLYNISVRSYTRLGHGNQLSSSLSVRTSETGKFFFICLFNNA